MALESVLRWDVPKRSWGMAKVIYELAIVLRFPESPFQAFHIASKNEPLYTVTAVVPDDGPTLMYIKDEIKPLRG